MPFDSTGFDQLPPRPEPSHGRRRRRRFVLLAALWGGVLAGGPVALVAWEAAHEPRAACDTPRGRPAPALSDTRNTGTAVQATSCDAVPRATASR